MNKGISIATGNFIIFLNADDIFATKDALETAVKAISEIPDADVVYGNLQVRSRDGGTFVFRPPPPEDAPKLMVCGCLPHQSTLARPSVFQKTNGFDEKYRVHSEYDWYLKVLADPEINIYRVECLIGSYFDGGTSSNLTAGQPEANRIQNSSPLYRSPEWDKKRIEIYQEQVLNLRIEIDRLQSHASSQKKHFIRKIFRRA